MPLYSIRSPLQRNLALAATLAALPALIWLLFFTGVTFAAETFVVNSTADVADATTSDGVCDSDLATPGLQCTLRAAVQQADPLGDVIITVPAGTYVLSITGTLEEFGATGDLDLRTASGGSLAINGAGPGLTIIDGRRIDRVFDAIEISFSGVGDVSVKDLTITNGGPTGFTEEGGGIRATGVRLTLENVAVTQGRAASGGGIAISGASGDCLAIRSSSIVSNTVFSAAGTARGGGLSITCGASISSSTISGNSVSAFENSSFGGGISFDSSAGSMTLQNTTISGNSAGTAGGGIYGTGSRLVSPLVNVTIANNSAGSGAGIESQTAFSAFNTLLAYNTSAGNPANCGSVAGFNSLGYNLSSDSSCSTSVFSTTTDLNNLDPLLGPLAFNGGPTQTHAPANPGSPLIDAGTDSSCPLVDQRGVTRPQGAGCDIGAYEQVKSADLAISKEVSSNTIVGGGTLTYTLNVTNNGPYPAAPLVPLVSNIFSNTARINIVDNAPATPYPAQIAVSGLSGSVRKVTATVANLSHSYPSDIRMLLVGPQGQGVVLLSDVGDSNDSISSTLTFDDNATDPVTTTLVSGLYPPSGGSSFFSPEPAGPYSPNLSAFNDTDPNGTWKLYVVDVFGGDFGQIAGGWSLQITTEAAPLPSITVEDTLPPEVNPASASISAGAGWNCGLLVSTVSCSRLDLPLGLAPPITIAVTTPITPGIIINSATISSSVTSDPLLDNNTDSARVTIAQEPSDLFANSFDLWLDPPTLIQGRTPPAIGLTIRREGGTADLANIAVDFYLGPPANGGTLLGRGTLGLLPPNSEAATSGVIWSTLPPPGLYTLYAVIDPNSSVPELNESNNLISRTVAVLPFSTDTAPPTIDSFSIDGGASFSSDREVTLNTTVSDTGGSGVARLLYIEYTFDQSVSSWTPVSFTPWLPYNSARANFPLNIDPTPGAHYIQVWAADQAGNISLLPRLQVINYLPAQAQVAQAQSYVFRLPLSAGQRQKVSLTSTSGNADIHIWQTNGTLVGLSELPSGIDEITFTAATSGVYQIEVDGITNATFSLEVLPLPAEFQNQGSIQGRGRPLIAPDEVPDTDVGLPPLSTNSTTYLPLVVKP